MAQINKPDTYFNTVTYTASGSGQSVTGVNFQPDLVWLKIRNTTGSHYLNDSVRGVQKSIYSNATDAEESDNYLTSFDSDGFSLGSGNYTSPNTIVGWNWLASNTTASNTDGSITSTVSANTTSGFSIVKYTGNGSTNQTVGHGLGVAPAFIMYKGIDAVHNWLAYHQSLGATKGIFPNLTQASVTSSSYFDDTAPTSSVFSVTTTGGADQTNVNSENYIAYCFAEKKGFSKFGSYTGNGSTDGTFVYTGMRPAFVMIKPTDVDTSWTISDNQRYPNNASSIPTLFPDQSVAEGSYSTVDYLSNGFKLRVTSSTLNGSGNNYIYMAFAEEPLVGDNPATAR